MIRNVVLVRLDPTGDVEADDRRRRTIDDGLAGIAALDLPGLLACHVGRDAGLRAGGWYAAITNDWADADAYRGYDVDPEHVGWRAMIVDAADDVARVQFEIP